MKEYTFDNRVEIHSPASPPNFDDERTVLSARPVIPLAKIDAKVRHRRRWFIGSAFALAMILGAASALLASYLKLRNAPAPVSEISVETQSSAPLAVVEPVASELPALGETEELSAEASATEEPNKKPAVKPNPSVKRSRQAIPPQVDGREISEEDELNRIREAVLFDAWEERRARRATRRERRNGADHHNRDLSNLDEIFEGRRKRP